MLQTRNSLTKIKQKIMLLTDDQDKEENYLQTMHGGNGDYYIIVKFKTKEGLWDSKGVRISTSGGNAPSEVKIAAAELYRAMEKHKLNEF